MFSLLQNCYQESSLFLIMDEHIQEYFNSNKINIVFITLGILYFLLLLKIYFISNMLIKNINKTNLHVDRFLHQIIEKYDNNNDNNKILNTKLYECISSVDNVSIDIENIKNKLLKINNDDTESFDIKNTLSKTNNDDNV